MRRWVAGGGGEGGEGSVPDHEAAPDPHTGYRLESVALTDADIAAGAAIAKSKLAALGIVNVDVDAAAAIAETKLSLASDAAAGTASRRTLGTGATQAAAGNHTHAGGGAAPEVGYQTGRTYGAEVTASSPSGVAISANTLYAVRVVARETYTFDQIGIRITAGATGNLRLGLYAADATDGFPGTRILDSGDLSTASGNTNATATISQKLQANTAYWLALVCSASPSLSALPTTSVPALFGATDYVSGPSNIIQRAFTYAALPDPWGTPTYGGGQAWNVRLRAA